MDKRMMMQTLQEIHHKSGELLQMRGQMMQREGYSMPQNMVQRDNGQMPNYSQNQGGMNQRQAYVDPWMY